MAGAVRIETPCKVNLYLGVHRERDARGYHRVDSLMVPVALFDEVVVQEAPELSVRFSPELGKTFAQASEEEKNSVSHRGRALAALKEQL